jgi:hypothetical protein
MYRVWCFRIVVAFFFAGGVVHAGNLTSHFGSEVKPLDAKAENTCAVAVARMNYDADPDVQLLGLLNLDSLQEHDLGGQEAAIASVVALCNSQDERCRARAVDVLKRIGPQAAVLEILTPRLIEMFQLRFSIPSDGDYEDSGPKKASDLATSIVRGFLISHPYSKLPEPLLKEIEAIDVGAIARESKGTYRNPDPAAYNAKAKASLVWTSATRGDERAIAVIKALAEAYPSERGLVFGIGEAGAATLANAYLRDTLWPALSGSDAIVPEPTSTSLNRDDRVRLARGLEKYLVLLPIVLFDQTLHEESVRTLAEAAAVPGLPLRFRKIIVSRFEELSPGHLEASPELTSILLRALKALAEPFVPVLEVDANISDWRLKQEVDNRNKATRESAAQETAEIQKAVGELRTKLGLVLPPN